MNPNQDLTAAAAMEFLTMAGRARLGESAAAALGARVEELETLVEAQKLEIAALKNPEPKK